MNNKNKTSTTAWLWIIWLLSAAMLGTTAHPIFGLIVLGLGFFIAFSGFRVWFKAVRNRNKITKPTETTNPSEPDDPQ